MTKNSTILKKFHRDSLCQEKFSYPQALKIFEGMFQEAKSLGVINPQNMLEGLEVDFRIAKALYKSRHV